MSHHDDAPTLRAIVRLMDAIVDLCCASYQSTCQVEQPAIQRRCRHSGRSAGRTRPTPACRRASRGRLVWTGTFRSDETRWRSLGSGSAPRRRPVQYRGAPSFHACGLVDACLRSAQPWLPPPKPFICGARQTSAPSVRFDPLAFRCAPAPALPDPRSRPAWPSR